MGMFDYINCEYPLPVDDAPKGDYQTKDTPAQSLDFYTIKADGTLWGQEYDIEDRSDPTAKGPLAMRGMMDARKSSRKTMHDDGRSCFLHRQRAGQRWVDSVLRLLQGRNNSADQRYRE